MTETTPTETAPAPEGQPANDNGTPAADKAAQIEADALADVTQRKQAREADLALAKLVAQHGEAIELMTKGEVRTALKKMLGPKYTPQLVLELTQDFPPDEELSVDDKIERKLAEKEAAAEAKRQEEERARIEAARAKADAQIDAFIDETATFLKANLQEYPGIEVYNITAEEIEKRLTDHFEKTGQVADPKSILDAYEAECQAKLAKTRLGTKLKPVLATDEDEVDDEPRLRSPAAPARKLTFEEQEALEAAQFDAQVRERLRRRKAS